jgi:hypothetical protein
MTWQLLLLAQDALRDGATERAEALASEGLNIARGAENPFGEGWALAHLAMVSEVSGNLSAAAQHMSSAREAVAAEDRWASELMRVALVRIWALQGDLDVARHHASESLRGFSDMSSSVEFGAALHAIGLIAHCEGDSVVAARLAGAADNLCPLAEVAPVLLGQEALRRDRELMSRRLGRERFDEEFDIGRHLRLVDAVKLATTVAHGSLQAA